MLNNQRVIPPVTQPKPRALALETNDRDGPETLGPAVEDDLASRDSARAMEHSQPPNVKT